VNTTRPTDRLIPVFYSAEISYENLRFQTQVSVTLSRALNSQSLAVLPVLLLGRLTFELLQCFAYFECDLAAGFAALKCL
jgi:hypothetical protein